MQWCASRTAGPGVSHVRRPPQHKETSQESGRFRRKPAGDCVTPPLKMSDIPLESTSHTGRKVSAPSAGLIACLYFIVKLILKDETYFSVLIQPSESAGLYVVTNCDPTKGQWGKCQRVGVRQEIERATTQTWHTSGGT